VVFILLLRHGNTMHVKRMALDIEWRVVIIRGKEVHHDPVWWQTMW
jgi:hypothetical protein